MRRREERQRNKRRRDLMNRNLQWEQRITCKTLNENADEHNKIEIIEETVSDKKTYEELIIGDQSMTNLKRTEIG